MDRRLFARYLATGLAGMGFSGWGGESEVPDTAKAAGETEGVKAPSVEVLDSVVDLRQFSPAQAGVVLVRGYHAPNDGGGGVFVWDGEASSKRGGEYVVPLGISGYRDGEETGGWVRMETEERARMNVLHYGAHPDGSHPAATTEAVQAALRDALETRGTLYFPAGQYRLTAPLVIDRPVEVVGSGAVTERWWPSTDESTTKILADHDEPAIMIASTELSGAGKDGIVEGVRMTGITVEPANGRKESSGILFDGSKVDWINRQLVRDVLLERVVVRSFGTHNLHFRGTAFDIRMRDCGFLRSGNHNVFLEESLSHHVDYPAQLHFDNCLLESKRGSFAFCASEGTGDVCFYGGIVAGLGSGVRTGRKTLMYGTHIETVRPHDSVGVHITGTECHLHPRVISSYDVGVLISGSRYMLRVPLIKAESAAIRVEAGAPRIGKAWISRMIAQTKRIDDRRFERDGQADFQLMVLYDVGGTPSRPRDCSKGTQYYDTDLERPIWWNGGAWVDAEGQPV